MTRGVRILACALALSIGAGCSSAPPDEESSSDDAISSAEAMNQYSVKATKILPSASATPGNRLGIAAWDVWEYDADQGGTGVLAFAMNAQGNVRYAMVIDGGAGGRGRAGIIRYNDTGPLKGGGKFTAEQGAAFDTELARLTQALQSRASALTAERDAAVRNSTYCHLRNVEQLMSAVLATGSMFFDFLGVVGMDISSDSAKSGSNLGYVAYLVSKVIHQASMATFEWAAGKHAALADGTCNL